jgi:hypothetical protein
MLWGRSILSPAMHSNEMVFISLSPHHHATTGFLDPSRRSFILCACTAASALGRGLDRLGTVRGEYRASEYPPYWLGIPYRLYHLHVSSDTLVLELHDCERSQKVSVSHITRTAGAVKGHRQSVVLPYFHCEMDVDVVKLLQSHVLYPR